MTSDTPPNDHTGQGCGGLCRTPLDFTISMAFQPIVDLPGERIFAHEALVRGPNGESAGSVLAKVDTERRYAFDQACRVTAIETAAEIGLGELLSINFMPNAVYEPANCIKATLAAANRVGLAVNRLIFEATEGERVVDHNHLTRILTEYKRQGFRTAIDDFGSGYSGLNLLARFQPDIIKLDMELVRGIDVKPASRSIVRAVLGMCHDLSITPIVEGVETEAEARTLLAMGVRLFQGYLFAKPAWRSAALPRYLSAP